MRWIMNVWEYNQKTDVQNNYFLSLRQAHMWEQMSTATNTTTTLPTSGAETGQPARNHATMCNCAMCWAGGWSTTPSMAWTMTPPWSLLHGLAGCTTRQTKPPWKRWQFLDNLLWGDKKSRLCTYCKWYLRLLLTTLGCQNILRTPPALLRDVTVSRGQWIPTCPTPQPSPRYIPIAWNVKKDFINPSFARLKLGFLPKTTRAEFCIVDLLNKSIVSKRT